MTGIGSSENCRRTRKQVKYRSRIIADLIPEVPLMGRIFDDCGNRISPTHTRKRGITYRYYMSARLLQGQPERAGTTRRVPAAEVEKIVADTLRREIDSAQKTQSDARFLKDHAARVEVRPNKLVIELKAPKTRRLPFACLRGDSGLHRLSN
jgi:hypothetical protein